MAFVVMGMRQGLHVRDGSGSGGIVSQMKASIESKAKAAAGSPRNAVQTNTKAKINVSVTDFYGCAVCCDCWRLLTMCTSSGVGGDDDDGTMLVFCLDSGCM